MDVLGCGWVLKLRDMINVGLSCCLCLFDNLNWMQGFDVTGNSLTRLLSLTQTGFEVKFLDQPLTKSSLEKILNPIKLDKMWFIWAEDIFRWLCQKYAKGSWISDLFKSLLFIFVQSVQCRQRVDQMSKGQQFEQKPICSSQDKDVQKFYRGGCMRKISNFIYGGMD